MVMIFGLMLTRAVITKSTALILVSTPRGPNEREQFFLGDLLWGGPNESQRFLSSEYGIFLKLQSGLTLYLISNFINLDKMMSEPNF